jgi:hypothetical protein
VPLAAFCMSRVQGKAGREVGGLQAEHTGRQCAGTHSARDTRRIGSAGALEYVFAWRVPRAARCVPRVQGMADREVGGLQAEHTGRRCDGTHSARDARGFGSAGALVYVFAWRVPHAACRVCRARRVEKRAAARRSTQGGGVLRARRRECMAAMGNECERTR